MTTVKAKIKTIVIGDQSTGKTSIITQFINRKFNEGSGPTIGIDFLSRNINVQGSEFRIQLWDTAGQERFRSLIPSYLKDAAIVIIVFDVSNYKTFEHISVWFDLYRQHRTQKSFCVLVGNKTDLTREITKEQGQQKAKQYQALYMETSAKTASNIQNLFMDAVKNWRQNLFTGTANTIVTQYDLYNSVVVKDQSENKTSILGVDKFKISDDQTRDTKKQKKKKCC